MHGFVQTANYSLRHGLRVTQSCCRMIPKASHMYVVPPHIIGLMMTACATQYEEKALHGLPERTSRCTPKDKMPSHQWAYVNDVDECIEAHTKYISIFGGWQRSCLCHFMRQRMTSMQIKWHMCMKPAVSVWRYSLCSGPCPLVPARARRLQSRALPL
jgi:hypothetical protein